MIILQRGLFSLAAATVLCAVPAYADCYDYDDLGRLIAVDYDGDTSKSTYVLDEHGNRQSVSVVGQGGVCIQPSGIASSGEMGPSVSHDYSNAAPIADNESVIMPINSSMDIHPLVGDIDPDGDILTLISVTERTSEIVLPDGTVVEIVGLSGITMELNGNVLTVATPSEVPEPNIILDYIVSDEMGATDTGIILLGVGDDGSNEPDIEGSGEPEDIDDLVLPPQY